jgi:hypothetical protein
MLPLPGIFAHQRQIRRGASARTSLEMSDGRGWCEAVVMPALTAVSATQVNNTL